VRNVEVESLAELDALVAAGARSLHGVHLQSLDLTGHRDVLAGLDVAGAVFLGCRLPEGSGPGSEGDLRRRGGLIFPSVPDVPVDPYRATLYSPEELYRGLDEGYDATPDALAYAWSRRPRSLDLTLAQALHDHSVDDALDEFAGHRRMVGVLGGHAVERGSPAYLAAARLGRALAGHHTVATGGGPGAMEAANLGAWLGETGDAEVTEAVGLLAAVPTFADVTAWARTAFAVRTRWPDGVASLGVPTWFYGHEPPNVFASMIAKYFRNAIREDVLLRVCRSGLVFLPGAAGTVQEVFQAVCTDYYAPHGTEVPLVFVGRDHWSRQLPVWDLLTTLSRDRPFGARVHLVDDPSEVLPLLLDGS
jgi:predicted Rossmann-fold nucleotide-binding protein